MRSVPRSREHLAGISRLSETVRAESRALLHSPEYDESLQLVGSSLAALFEVASCNRKCFGDSHILESLAARTYNLGCSAYLLAERAFYDEAM